ncbi:MAG: YgiT-type zinc finger protein [Methanomicrobia archaeon]|nr:YgiT-type zinc finger protein [Methanomicrobia archaeon]
MKTCYMCGGDIERRIMDVEVEGVIVKDVPVEVCTRCGEQYFNTRAATFVQKITRYVNDAKKGYLIDVFNP